MCYKPPILLGNQGHYNIDVLMEVAEDTCYLEQPLYFLLHESLHVYIEPLENLNIQQIQ